MKYQFVISGEIGVRYDWWTGQRGTTAKEVRDFLDKHQSEEVHIAVSSPGGYVDAGLEIYQFIKDHGNVHMHIVGMTASAATFLTMGAKTIDMVDGSLMLIHNASTPVVEWQSANKKQLDAIIEKYQKERKDLDTIDRVIASLYAKKSGKSLDECLAKMDKAAWLSPNDALAFGLIDEIRADEHDELMTQHCRNFITNYSKNYGLPPFPADIVAVNDDPTKSFFRKSADAVKSIFRNNSAKKEKPMIKIFMCVMSLLGIKDGLKTNDDGSISLTQEQMKTIDDRLGTLEKDVTYERNAKDDLQMKLDSANESLKVLQEQLDSANETIKNLKSAPGAETKVNPNNEYNEDDFLTEAMNSYKRIENL